ncbi:hypothetical protein OIV83_001448 [Microbotryomycetes sp. JL201]|nr:hypothetical protein OIV83_001448 [Microbotryomycetes sp. JL201]
MPSESTLRTRPIAPEPASKRSRVHAPVPGSSVEPLPAHLYKQQRLEHGKHTALQIQPYCDSTALAAPDARHDSSRSSLNLRRSSLPCIHDTAAKNRVHLTFANLTANTDHGGAPALARRRSLAAQSTIIQHGQFAAAKVVGSLRTQPKTTRQTTKTVLGTLPLNHTVARPSATMLVKRSRDAENDEPATAGATAPIGHKVARRMSGALLGLADDEAEESLPSSKRKRPGRGSTSRRDSSSEHDKDGSQAKRRRSRPGNDRDGSSRRTSRRNSSSSTAHSSSATMADEQPEQDDYCMYEASARELCSLTRSELARLYAHATHRTLAATGSLSKAALAKGIVRARSNSTTNYAVDTDEDDSDSDSPRPLTSHEASPAPSPHRRLGRTRSSRSSMAAGDGEDKHLNQPGRAPRHMRTRSESLTDVFAAATLNESSKPVSAIRLRPRRRSSLLEVTTEFDENEIGKRLQRHHLEALDELETENTVPNRLPSFTPIAYRTRRTNATSSSALSPRPSRAAKSQATARIVQTPIEDSSSGDSVSADDLNMDLDETNTAVSDITPRRTVKRQVSTATPSDADDESGDESADELSDKEDNQTLTAAFRGPRQLRNGKVVPLIEEEPEEMNEQSVEVDDESNDMDDNDDEVDVMTATSKTLLRYRRDELLRLCEERGVELDGTKKELVQALLQWRETHEQLDSDASTASCDSTVSNASVMTARAETKTEALRAAASPKPRRGMLTPLLMREGHSPSPEKPKSPQQTKEDEQEEVNALDLESLQLQDKEIAPEKLTKLEKVGSGGFKDVYKGVYRKKTIAIADIRGHLTEMDIKELGLLRDLRHPNIVHFIGVSIPKEPSTVPVMIVTELCANGDLFDYIRAVEPPPFLNMLEILLGIARGLGYLHTRTPTIIHRDIKSSNILITANGVAKLADFGLAKIKNSKRAMIRSLVGTVNWQAPELWVPHPRYNEKVDVYSVGLVFWEALQWHQAVKRYPFEGMNEHAIYDQVGHKNLRPSTASLRRVWGGEIVDLMTTMWSQEAVHRPPMTQVVAELERLIKAERERVRQERRRH